MRAALVMRFFPSVHTAVRLCMQSMHTSSVRGVVGATVVATSFTKLLSNQLQFCQAQLPRQDL